MSSSFSNRIRIGVIGLGWPGQMHSAAIAATPGASLYGISDLSEQALRNAQSVTPALHQFRDYREMLADPKVDAVVIGLPNFLHFTVSLDALKAGKHVLCEKPPTMDTKEMKRLKAAADRRGLTYAFGRQSRFSGEMQKARQLVKAGRLGDVYYAKTHWYRSRGIPVGVGGWFTDAKRSGGGAIIDIGIHTLDNAWFLMGAPRPVAVSAQVFQKFGRLVPKEIRNDVDDCGFAFIRFENDAVISLETTWAANLPPSKVEGWNGSQSSLLFGTKASLETAPLRLYSERGTGVKETAVPSRTADRFKEQMKDFVRAVRTGAPPTSDAEQAIHLMQMLDAIYKSSRIGREVRIAG
jgi:predicted dehydrogenase